MPRGPRILPPEGVFHLICRGNNDIALCKFPRDYLAIKWRLERFFVNEGVQIYHYCLMKTHFHLLAFVPDTSRLQTMMKAMQLAYFHHYRRRYHYKGHLFHSRYRSISIHHESHFLQCGRYIELNSVHASLVSDPVQYPWSSYHFYAEKRIDELITPNPMFIGDGGIVRDAASYRQFVLEGINHDYQRMKKLYEGKEF